MTNRLTELVRYGVSSVGGLLANLALLTVWVDGLGFAAWWAVGINWVVIATASYHLADRWVFADRASAETPTRHVTQFLGMESIMFLGKGLNYLIYLALLSVIDYRVAWTVGAVATFGVTYVLNRRWWDRLASAG